MLLLLTLLFGMIQGSPTVSLVVDVEPEHEGSIVPDLVAALGLRGVTVVNDGATQWRVHVAQTPAHKAVGDAADSEDFQIYQVTVYGPNGRVHGQRVVATKSMTSANWARVLALAVVEMLAQPAQEPVEQVVLTPPELTLQWPLHLESALRYRSTSRVGLVGGVGKRFGAWEVAGGVAVHVAFNRGDEFGNEADAFVPGNGLGTYVGVARRLAQWERWEAWSAGGLEAELSEAVLIRGNSAVATSEAFATHMRIGLELRVGEGRNRPIFGLGWRQPLLKAQWQDRSYRVSGAVVASMGFLLGAP